MKDIVLVTNYWHFDCEKASARYSTLANMIVARGYQLEVITSTFYHGTKSQRNFNSDFFEQFPFKVTLQYEPGYPRNVCLQRFYSQSVFAKNVLKYLKKRKRPDVIYCVIPSTDVAYKISKFAKAEGIPFIIDIQDLWPEAFKVAVNIPLVSDLAFYPIKRKAEIAYSNADKIVAVSQTYVDRAKRVNSKYQCAIPIYLGIELAEFNQIAESRPMLRKPGDGFWIAYIGTLGHSYDIMCVIRAIKVLKDKGIDDIYFYVMGYGPLEQKFRDFANEQGVSDNVIFTGRLVYSDMVQRLCECDVAINPIVPNAAQSITNKHGDYFASKLPIISTQNSAEYQALLERYEAGINCSCGNYEELAKSILYLKENPAVRKQMGVNSGRVARELFDRRTTYKKIVDLLE